MLRQAPQMGDIAEPLAFSVLPISRHYRRQCLRDWLDFTFIRIVLDAVNRAAYGVHRLHEACIVGTQHGSCVGVNLLPS